MDITTATPAEIDTRLARVMNDLAMANATIERTQQVMRRIDSVQGTYEADYAWNSPAKRAEAEQQNADAWKVSEERLAEMTTLNAEFTRRGGWTRFYLVTNAGGHVHWTQGCNTCFPTTQFAWLTEQSGMTHEALVELAGEKACTVCFPDAPVDVLRRPSRLSDPERAARAAEKAEKQAEKQAAQITFAWVESGRVRDKTFKTLRAATNALAGALGSLCWYGTGHPTAPEWEANVKAGREALGEAWDYDKALAAARKKSVKDAGQYLHEEVIDFDPETRKYITRWSDEPLYPKY